jgi:hypothetical protein
MIDDKLTSFNKLLVYIVGALVCLNFLSLIYAGYWLRPLAGEGAPWIFQILNFGEFSYDATFTRYANLILQIPTVLITRFGVDPSIGLQLICLMYSLPSILSLIFCAVILYRRKRLDLFLYPLIGFATISSASLSQPFTLGSDVLVICWPLLLLAFMPIKNSFNWLAILTLTLAASFSHETGFVLLFILFILKFFDALRFSRNARKPHWILTALFVLGTGWLIYRAFGVVQVGDKIFFLQALHKEWDKWFVYKKAALSFFILLSFLSYFKFRSSRYLLSSVIIISVGLFFYFIFEIYSSLGMHLFIPAYNARTWTVLPTAVLFILFYFNLINTYDELFNNFKTTTLLIVLSFSLLISLGHDLKMTYEWSKGIQLIESKFNSVASCIELSAQEARQAIEYGISNREMPQISLLLSQRKYGQSKNVLMTKINRLRGVPKACCLIRSGNFPIYERELKYNSNWNYNLKEIINATQSMPDLMDCPNS